MAIIRQRVTIRGVRPLVWHAWSEEAIPLEQRREREGVAGRDPGEWRRTVLVTKAGELYLKPQQVFSCLREAARFTKAGRGTLERSVAATLLVEDARVLTGLQLPDPPSRDDEAPVYLLVEGVKNPATKARNVRYRVAAAPGWRLSFTLLHDSTIVTREQLAAVLRDAGTLVGIGNGRSIGYGRFVVEGAEVLP